MDEPDFSKSAFSHKGDTMRDTIENQRLHDHIEDKDRIEAAYRRGCHQVVSMLVQFLGGTQVPLD